MIQDNIAINKRPIGTGHPTYVIAEMSANHHHDYNRAVDIIKAAKECGADAIKLQTYTPDTMTVNVHNEYFRVIGTIWEDKYLYDLYEEAFTPWDWQPKLKKIAEKIGLDFFSTPFDVSAVEFLKKINVPAYKIASFEIVDLPLLAAVAKTKKPVIMSIGMASLAEIDEAVKTLHHNGAEQIALLKCTSSYPATPSEMNLRTIPHLSAAFGVPTGLSDHTRGTEVALASVALGACIIEKHFTLSRKTPGPDSAFSLEPDEFKDMVHAIRNVEKALGQVAYRSTKQEQASHFFRRSLFVVKTVKKGEVFTIDNIRSIRPGFGMHTRYMDEILGRQAIKNIEKGTPLSWDLVS